MDGGIENLIFTNVDHAKDERRPPLELGDNNVISEINFSDRTGKFGKEETGHDGDDNKTQSGFDGDEEIGKIRRWSKMAIANGTEGLNAEEKSSDPRSIGVCQRLRRKPVKSRKSRVREKKKGDKKSDSFAPTHRQKIVINVPTKVLRNIFANDFKKGLLMHGPSLDGQGFIS